ncbi:hypothetical protein Hanom_Chr00s000001g01597041 [Helianthus anomalus]
MSMVWRVLYTLEHIVEQEGIDIGMFRVEPTLSPCHTFKSHLLPKKEYKLDLAIRTFPPRSKDTTEISSTSYTMSSDAKSSKSASRFSVADLQDIASPWSLNKELAASQSNPEANGMSTTVKGTKRKKPTESSEGLPQMEHQFHDYVSDKFAEVQILLDQRLAEADEKVLDLQKIALVKDKKISSIEKDNNTLHKELLIAEITANKERIEIMDGAKLSATSPC